MVTSAITNGAMPSGTDEARLCRAAPRSEGADAPRRITPPTPAATRGRRRDFALVEGDDNGLLCEAPHAPGGERAGSRAGDGRRRDRRRGRRGGRARRGGPFPDRKRT